mmetsp:Transcript_7156/g.20773  ORF Transcript_7156/g.20773 Transcript_7156/m.20773 type:complete len:207 (+) Transcript_7156:1421-2041(+)
MTLRSRALCSFLRLCFSSRSASIFCPRAFWKAASFCCSARASASIFSRFCCSRVARNSRNCWRSRLCLYLRKSSFSSGVPFMNSSWSSTFSLRLISGSERMRDSFSLISFGISSSLSDPLPLPLAVRLPAEDADDLDDDDLEVDDLDDLDLAGFRGLVVTMIVGVVDFFLGDLDRATAVLLDAVVGDSCFGLDRRFGLEDLGAKTR